MVYNFPFDNGQSASSYIDAELKKFISWMKFNSTSGFGYILYNFIQLFINGVIIGVSVYVASRFVTIPGPSSVFRPVTNLAK